MEDAEDLLDIMGLEEGGERMDEERKRKTKKVKKVKKVRKNNLVKRRKLK